MADVALVAGVAACVLLSALLLLGGTPALRLGAKRKPWGGARDGERRSPAERRRACLAELPVMLDVLTLGLSAGLSFDAALELYCERNDTDLGRVLAEAMLAWRMGIRSREAELVRVADELGLPAFRRFASMVAEALERQGEAIREEQRSQVEEEIERVPVKMLVPLGTLIVPAMLLAILGPLLGQAVTFGEVADIKEELPCLTRSASRRGCSVAAGARERRSTRFSSEFSLS